MRRVLPVPAPLGLPAAWEWDAGVFPAPAPLGLPVCPAAGTFLTPEHFFGMPAVGSPSGDPAPFLGDLPRLPLYRRTSMSNRTVNPVVLVEPVSNVVAAH